MIGVYVLMGLVFNSMSYNGSDVIMEKPFPK